MPFFNDIPDDKLPYHFDFDLSFLTWPDPPAWWTAEGGKFAKVSLRVRFPNGQIASVRLKGNFTIYKPTVTFSDSGSYTVALGHLGLYPAIRLGDDSGAGAMAFQGVVESPIEGEAKAVQIFNRSCSHYVLGLGVSTAGGTEGEFWLDADPYDTVVPVQRANATDIHPPSGVVLVTDRPGIPLAGSAAASINDSFKTYIMFRPSGLGNVWVSLGRVDWNWFGNADLTGPNSFDVSSWSLTSSGVTGPHFSSTQEPPVWENIYVH